MKTRHAGVLALLALGLIGAPTAAADGADAPTKIFTSLPAAPVDFVTDNAQILSPEARDRLADRLRHEKETGAFIRLYVYTLRSAGGARPADAAQELYRRWKMKERELWDGIATIFVFWDDKKALVMLGQGAPARAEEALHDLAPDLDAVFAGDPEGALGRVIDRISKSLEGDTSSWVDAPPAPDAPSGPVHGNPDFADETETRALEAAVTRASTPEHPITLVLNPAKGLDSPAQRAEKLGKAWPDRILLVASRGQDLAAELVIPEGMKDRFPEDQRERILHEVRAAMTNATYSRTLARAVGELAMLAEGKTPPPWIAWKHPLKTIGGGQDEDPAPLALGITIAVVLIVIVSWFLYLLFTDPKAVLLWIGVNLAEAVIGGLFGGGGGGSSGGGFSGGGGSFGGGGASGSW